ncbi:MAG: hypothetical protein R3A48_28725 [Polyangiales bacterium]
MVDENDNNQEDGRDLRERLCPEELVEMRARCRIKAEVAILEEIEFLAECGTDDFSQDASGSYHAAAAEWLQSLAAALQAIAETRKGGE